MGRQERECEAEVVWEGMILSKKPRLGPATGSASSMGCSWGVPWVENSVALMETSFAGLS